MAGLASPGNAAFENEGKSLSIFLRSAAGVLASCNLRLGVALNLPLVETALYVGSMLCVGFPAELIFRGVLSRAMSRDNVQSAIIVFSLTFGIEHLVNGSDMGPPAISVCSVVAFGFLCVVVFRRGRKPAALYHAPRCSECAQCVF